MARTIDQIYQSILTAKTQKAELAVLTNQSETSLWKLWAYITAMALYIHETLWDKAREELQSLADQAPAGTAPWYAHMMKKFQIDDYLQVVAGTAGYAQTDESKQIVKHAAYTAAPDGSLTLKIAKEGAGGRLCALTTAELAQAQAYLNQIKFVGAPLTLVSRNADLLYLQIEVFYTPQYDPVALKETVKNALTDYLARPSEKGVLYAHEIYGVITSVEGVEDVAPTTIEITNAEGVTTLNQSMELYAGYAKEETAPGRTFDDGLSFTELG